MKVRELRYARLFNFPGKYENERVEVVFELDEGEDVRTAWARAYDLVHMLHEVGEAIRRFKEIEDEAWHMVRHYNERIDEAHRDIGRYTAEVEKWEARAREAEKEHGRIPRTIMCELGDAEERLEQAKERLSEYKRKQKWYEEMAKRASELSEHLSDVMRNADFTKVQELLAGQIAEFMEAWHKGPSEE